MTQRIEADVESMAATSSHLGFTSDALDARAAVLNRCARSVHLNDNDPRFSVSAFLARVDRLANSLGSLADQVRQDSAFVQFSADDLVAADTVAWPESSRPDHYSSGASGGTVSARRPWSVLSRLGSLHLPDLAVIPPFGDFDTAETYLDAALWELWAFHEFTSASASACYVLVCGGAQYQDGTVALTWGTGLALSVSGGMGVSAPLEEDQRSGRSEHNRLFVGLGPLEGGATYATDDGFNDPNYYGSLGVSEPTVGAGYVHEWQQRWDLFDWQEPPMPRPGGGGR